MLSEFFSTFVAPVLLLSALVQGAAQVDKSAVGPRTPLSSKSKICNVLDYGAKADNKTDIGPAIGAAFSKCASAGKATIYIPPGSYLLASGVKLNKGSAYAIQIDGLITLTSNGNFKGNAFILQNCQDVEVFSSNGLGAINGQGYITRLTKSGQNARLFRFINAVNISIHDIIFVDSPTFHLIFNDVTNLHAYHITIRGPSIGGTDGIDLICTENCYLHDIEVTNRDECIAVKSPSNNVLIEDIVCNQSGGMSIGSLDAKSGGAGPKVSNITMRNILVYQSTQMLMIKTYPGGNGAVGYVKDSLFENFWAYDTTYALDIDQYWQQKLTPDTGAVALSSLTFRNWTGTVINGVGRAPVVIRGSRIVPLTDITLQNFDMWTVVGKKVLNQCRNVYGSGYCARSSTQGQKLTEFTSTQTSTAPLTGFTSPTKPKWAIQGYGVTIPIPVYTPAPLWAVGGGSISTVVVASSSKASTLTSVVIASSTKNHTTLVYSTRAPSTHIPTATTKVAVSSVPPKSVTTRAPVVGGTLPKYSQCGGRSWEGAGECEAGSKCVVNNEWYSQCL